MEGVVSGDCPNRLGEYPLAIQRVASARILPRRMGQRRVSGGASRTILWSSAGKIRKDLSIFRRCAKRELGTVPRAGADDHRPTQGGKPLLEPDHPEAWMGSWGQDLRFVEANPVILHHADDIAVVVKQADPGMRGSRMPGDVGKSLLDDPVECDFQRRSQACRYAALDPHAHTTPPGHAFSANRRRRVQPG